MDKNYIMKRTILFTLFTSLLSAGLYAQVETEIKTSENKTSSNHVKKEVKMTNENGVKKLTITTDNNGVVSEEVYEGEAAEEKLADLQRSNPNAGDKGETMEVKMTEVNGQKQLKIIKRKDGKESVEVYEGEEAEKKLKELEAGENSSKKQKVIVKEKKKIEKSDM